MVVIVILFLQALFVEMEANHLIMGELADLM
jgi:hypothetical protein